MLADRSDIVVELVKAGANLDLSDKVCMLVEISLKLLILCCLGVQSHLRTTHIIVCVHVTQNGDSALTLAARHGRTYVVVELVKAGANLDLQNHVLTSFCTS